MKIDRRASSTTREVISNQQGVHPRLEEVVQRHSAHEWRQPIKDHNQEAFDLHRSELESNQFVLDVGCGTGLSTVWLAKRYPDKLVFGIDRSDDRLSRRKTTVPANVRYVRADMEDWWRLCANAGLVADHQAIYYPNPYPKAAQLMRRWHAHPVLPFIIKCGGSVEIRSNWETYIHEAEIAFNWHLGASVDIAISQPTDVPITAFEAKYMKSGQPLFSLNIG